MEIRRELNLDTILQKRSCFLFGPRQIGKSFLIRHQLRYHRYYDLLDTDLFLRLSTQPSRLREELTEPEQIVVIDEIQKLPILLDEVHLLIETRGIRFLLTGSSARKLKSSGVNLLGGRARTRRLHPFIYRELREEFDLQRALTVGLVPSIYFSDEPEEDLSSYVGTYLTEEIVAEALVRNVPAFSRFLRVAGWCHGKMINYENIASDAEIPRSTVRDYFQILRDTLVGEDLPAWRHSQKRKSVSTAKFYFFDGGVVNALNGRRHLSPGAPEYGEAFETYIYHEIKSYCEYNGIRDLHYWRSKSGIEVDFIINNRIAVEVKAKPVVANRDLKNLRLLKEENLIEHYVLVSLESSRRIVDDIEILSWQAFIEKLWDGAYST